MFSLLKKLFWALLLCVSVGTMAGIIYIHTISKDLPNIDELKSVAFETPMHIYSSDGKLMYVFGKIKREPVSIKEIPQKLINAFISIEDQRFYEHTGFDIVGIARAGLEYIKSGKKKQGASTITQQVAKNFFLTRERTFTRKIKELLISLDMEQMLTKDQILELYLNKIALGHNSYGVVAAAKVYFGKHLKDLTLGEIAILAGLPKAPSTYNPISHPDNALKRRNLVLSKMLEYGYITKEEYDTAYNEKIVSSYHGPEIEFRADYISEMARQRVIERFGENVTTQGIKVFTTVNSEVQQLAQDAVYKGLTEYDRRHGYRGPVAELWNGKDKPWSKEDITKHLQAIPTLNKLIPAVVVSVEAKEAQVIIKSGEEGIIPWDNIKWARKFLTDRSVGASPKSPKDVLKSGQLIYVTYDEKGELELGQVPAAQSALVSIDPQNGAIRALVGGFSFYQSKFNRAEQARRQAGSNIKPFIYSAALSIGYTPSTLVMDVPITTWETGKHSSWQPKNSPNVYDGPITLREALAKSKNVVSVRLLRAVGIEGIVSHLEKFGLPVPKLYHNAPLALGAVDLTPLEVARGYAAIANGGFLIHPYIVQRIEDDNGKVLYEANPVIACPSCADHVDDGLAYSDGRGHKIAKQIITHANAFLVSELMHTGIYGGADRGLHWFNGTGWRSAKAMPNRHDLSGKTGTTNDSKDCWFSGLNGSFATSVWIGFDNQARSLGRESGATAAQPIWNYFMVPYLKDKPENPVRRPSTVFTHKVSPSSGLFVGDSTPGARNEFFEENTDPADHSAYGSGDNNGYFNYGDQNVSDGDIDDEIPSTSDIF